MSLSRRYRPQVFGDITGQDSIKETLRKEVALKRIGHAYLFSGPRGVGKTTTARIFAKALNCADPKEGEPCLTCASCVETQEARALDVIEMDAASHTGVDMVREAIIEHVRFAPSSRSYKIYILDEAHMLSTAAWNALLKTLEEPPAYAVFILATTEFHKVPATIVSRCQRFDFKRISEEQLRERINVLATKEKLEIEPAVAVSIAKHSDGCVRDAESLLDQLIALGESHITEELASLVMPVSRIPRAAELFRLVQARELGSVLDAIGLLEDDGIALLPMFDDLLECTRQLLLCAGGPKRAQELAQGDEGERALASLASAFSVEELGEIALVLMERRRDAKQGIDPRFALELALAAITVRGSNPISKSLPQTPLQKIPSPPAAQHVEPASLEIPSGGVDLSLGMIQKKWTAFLRAVDEKNKSLPFILKICRPEAVHGKTVTLRFQYLFHKQKIVDDAKNKRLVDEVLSTVLGISGLNIDGIIGENEEQVSVKPTTIPPQDMVTDLLQAFGGQVIDEAAT